MYKALHKPSGEDVIIIDQRWQDQIEALRAFDRKDELVCPGCEQPVRVKAGQVRRWHFAHKHLRNCPYERESPILLETRGVLYKFLVIKFEGDLVTLEKNTDRPGLPRHIDCWVEKEGRNMAYWIFDRRLPPDERADLRYAFENLDTHVTWVFVEQMLRMDETHSSRIHLTTTERAFSAQTDYDLAWQTHFARLGGSLHYLDAKHEKMFTFRNLNIYHAPQLYSGKKLETALSDLLVSPETGEFVHPGEHEKLEQRRRERVVEGREQDRRLRQATAFLRRLTGQAVDAADDEVIQSSQGPQSGGELLRRPFQREAACKFCGTLTSDWISYDGKTGRCICRACKDKV